MLRYLIFSCSSTWYLVLRCLIFSCISTWSWCYAPWSSLAFQHELEGGILRFPLAFQHELGAPLLDLLLHFNMIFSCISTWTWCSAPWSSLAFQHGAWCYAAWSSPAFQHEVGATLRPAGRRRKGRTCCPHSQRAVEYTSWGRSGWAHLNTVGQVGPVGPLEQGWSNWSGWITVEPGSLIFSCISTWTWCFATCSSLAFQHGTWCYAAWSSPAFQHGTWCYAAWFSFAVQHELDASLLDFSCSSTWCLMLRCLIFSCLST